jgi:hypothetical protein
LIFVAARGGVNSGSAYEHLDAGLPDGRYYYWLIEVENNGKETFYGPVSAVLGLDTPDMWPRLYLPLIQSGQPRP